MKSNILEQVQRWIIISFTVISTALAINQVFDLQFFIGSIWQNVIYHFALLGLLLPLIFIVKPLGGHQNLRWIDASLFLVAMGGCFYFAWLGMIIISKGYGYFAPNHIVVIAAILWILVVEAVRRGAGAILMIVVAFFSLYPLFASHMPGFMEGVQRSFSKTALFHILSTESVMGTLMDIFGGVVFGFIIFGVAVVETGGSDFLLKLANSMVGGTRGGAAKIAVIASGFFGSISGSAMANVLTTGSVTIPMMVRIGYSPRYAGAVETCASTAGTMTPPIMGAAAFVLASFIDMPYAYVAMGAAIPAFLFYLTLLVQVDGHAAKKEMKEVSGLDELPLKQVLRDGWFYIPTMAVLLYVLFIMRWTGESAYISTAVLLLLAQTTKKSRFTLKRFLIFLENTGKSLAVMAAVLAGAGMLMGSFSLTGIAATFSRELFLLAGGSIPLMLIFTAIASMILGMGMTVIACYIFLALVVAPALVAAGLNELAVHLYVLYCGMLSFITPPVALCAYAASSIAKVPPIKIAILSCRLGGAIFILPFFFVIDPALVMQGSAIQIIIAFITASVGMLLIGSALEGYLIGIGELRADLIGYLQRAVLAASGIAFALPGWKFDMAGLFLTIMTMITFWASHRNKLSVNHIVEKRGHSL